MERKMENEIKNLVFLVIEGIGRYGESNGKEHGKSNRLCGYTGAYTNQVIWGAPTRL